MAAARPPTPTAAHYRTLAVALLVLTAYGSFIPLRYRPLPLGEAIAAFRQIRSYDPGLLFARGDWVVNSAQYATLSFVAAGALAVDRRRPLGRLVALAVLPTGGLLAIILEFLQLYFPPRTVSRNDLIVEWSGIVVGVVAWMAAGQGLTDWLRRFWGRKGIGGLASQALPVYLAVLLAASLMPFDLVVGRAELASKVSEGRVNLLPFCDLRGGVAAALSGQVVNLSAFAVLGALIAASRGRRPIRWSWLLMVGLGAAGAIELLQLFVYTRYFDATDILSGAAGVVIGGRLAGRALRSSRVRRLGSRLATGPGHDRRRWAVGALALGIWGGVLMLANWWPFHFSVNPAEFAHSDPSLTDENTSIFGLRRVAWAPLVDYYWGSRYDALDQFLRRSLSFAPIGLIVALTRGPRERGGLTATLTLAAGLALSIELGQYFIPERHPGTTDVLIEILGAGLGFALARHASRAFVADVDAMGNARYTVGRPPADDLRPARLGIASAGRSAARRLATAAGQGRARRRTAAALRGLGARNERALAWLEAQPFGLRLAVIAVASIALAVVLAKLALWMHWA